MADGQPAPSTETATVAVGGHTLRVSVCEHAASDAPPLFLLGGLGGNIELWDSLRAALPGRTTIAYDAPGTGRSSTHWRPLAISELAGVVSLLLDELHIGEVDVVGYSFGGFVAQELARREPRVRRLVLAATGCGMAQPGESTLPMTGRAAVSTPLAMASLMTPARYHATGPVGTGLLRLAFGDPTSIGLQSAARARRDAPPDWIGYWWQVMAASAWSSRGWLDEIRQPTLVVAGEHDPVAPPASGEFLAGRIPGARLVVVPDAGHSFLLADDVDGAAALIEGFLDQPSPDAQPVASSFPAT
ncbi:MAG: hypothetical protein AVDCRST_MAG50-1792 [uncultured Acidimicrobiales bacterium]|uniref:AB hydrolase-1 domain-containing protein n=1 Tax=uncultured Acidimicrobiales bacterium TaxID=310071 RepID=A0A6J4I7N8_9ACTN|nr:MAG: hypothetical protein AVDCRST_MAG50-1792 [uncultured Acidimicrobiales bacterium]